MSGIEFPNPTYFGYVEDQLRNAGIIVPFLSNDAYPHGYFAPGQPSAVDIYGHDGYPLGFDCASPYNWPDNDLPTYYLTLHRQQSPSTPYAITEFQAGSFDPWGGLGFDQCEILLNQEFERVFYKNDYSFGVTILNLYMIYGGTNWGNLGHPGGYTSYDYGAAIAEDRSITREKYSELKLEANFLQVSPAYLTAVAQNNTNANGSYTDNSAIAVTALLNSPTNFYVVRHAAYNTLTSTNYTITLPTSQGDVTIPQLGGSLVLNGRDSKFHVTDYDVGGNNLLYSSAEIFTWKKYSSKTILVVYGGPNEQHEFAICTGGNATLVEGSDVTIGYRDGASVVNFPTSSERRIVQFSNNLYVYILDRNSAYNYWVLDLPSNTVSGNYTNGTIDTSAAIIKAGYLLRTVEANGNTLAITGDLNATTSIEVIGGAPASVSCLTFNGQSIAFNQSQTGVVTGSAAYTVPEFSIPNLSTIGWKVVNSLPEIQSGYDDTLWTTADLTYSNNTARNLTAPVSTYSSDYGYHTGNLIYRGHFVAEGSETSVLIQGQGGSAFGMTGE